MNDDQQSIMEVKHLELQYQHISFFEGVLCRVKPTESLTIRERYSEEKFSIIKFHTLIVNMGINCEKLSLYMNKISPEDFTHFKHLPF